MEGLWVQEILHIPKSLYCWCLHLLCENLLKETISLKDKYNWLKICLFISRGIECFKSRMTLVVNLRSNNQTIVEMNCASPYLTHLVDEETEVWPGWAALADYRDGTQQQPSPHSRCLCPFPAFPSLLSST